MRSPLTISLAIAGCLGLLISCGTEAPIPDVAPDSTTEVTAPEAGPLKITVSVLPQKYFVEKIGGDRVQVSVLVGEGLEPESYEPKPQQLKDLSDADAYIGIGILFEEVWGDRLRSTNSEIAWVDSSAEVEKIPLANHFHHDHEDEDSHNHDHGDGHSDTLLDPHIWLSPQRVKQQAEQIYQLLAQLDPEAEVLYAENLGRFYGEIDQLDDAIRQRLAPLENRAFLVFHPAWGYFAADYNLEQIPIEVGGQEPSAAELAELVNVAQEKQIQTIFAQYQFNAQAAEAIAEEIDANVVYLDPLNPDWAQNLLDMTEAFIVASPSSTPLPETAE